MIGHTPTLHEIILSELPCPLDLYCHEEMVSEEELGGLSPEDSQSQPVLQVHVISSWCGLCEHAIQFTIRCTPGTLRQVHCLLLQDLELLCADCCISVS
uniref:Protein E7 n=1 Tax=Miniopterus schreibersii papillomavirus 1 TaxID=1195364 RepID=I3VR51_9PAPI|nr:E7 [Miniopterus schreibersii papillomavirus 1]